MEDRGSGLPRSETPPPVETFKMAISIRVASSGSNRTLLLPCISMLVCTAAWSQATKQVVTWGDNQSGGLSVPAGFSSVTQVAAGGGHVMVLRTNGTVTGWGQNNCAQVDGTSPWSCASKPAGLDRVTSIACGDEHTAAIRDDGTVVCWGRNDFGQCCNLNGVSDDVWRQPDNLGVAVSIACGSRHTAVSLANGDVIAWGRNDYRQCDGVALEAWKVSKPASIFGVTQVTCASSTTVALKADGSVFGWGYNGDGLCTPRRYHAPIRKVAGSSTSAHVLALLSDRTLKSWGWGGYGVLELPALKNVVDVAVSAGCSTALLADGTVRSWGTHSLMQATPPTNLTGVSSIVSGYRMTVALKPWSDCNRNGMYDGDDVAFGGLSDLDGNDRPDLCQGGVQYLQTSPDLGVPRANVSYSFTFNGLVPSDAAVQITVSALGDLDATNEFFTVRVSDGRGGPVTSLGKVFDLLGSGQNCSTGESVATIAVPKDLFNLFAASGSMSVSLLGSPAITASECANGSTRVQLGYLGIGPDGDCDGDGLLDVRQIAQNRNLDFNRNGRLDACDCRDNPALDRNRNGVLDSQDCVNNPALDCDVNDRIDAYELLDDPRLDCDGNGRLDACDTAARTSDSVIGWGLNWQVDQKGFITRPVLQIACGWDHYYALQNDGTLAGWGWNWADRLTTPRNLGPVSQVACGGGHTYALQKDGSLVGWGNNDRGQTTTPAGLRAIAVSCGNQFTLALLQNGTVRGWGLNSFGVTTPPSGLNEVVQIDCGGSHAYALKGDGSLVGWGCSDDDRTSTPTNIGLVSKVRCGDGFTYALRQNETVMGWGWNGDGNINTPPGLQDVVDIDCGPFHTFVLKRDGTVQGWGRNAEGELQVPTGLTAIRAVACGGASTFVLAGAVDANANGRADACDLADDPGLDRNFNGVIDALDIQRNPAIDCDSNWVIDQFDLIDHPEWDCDANARIDSCDYREGSPDENLDGHLDSCSYAKSDLDLDGYVNTADLSILLLYIGEVGSTFGDLDADGLVTTADVALMLLNFGPVTWP